MQEEIKQNVEAKQNDAETETKVNKEKEHENDEIRIEKLSDKEAKKILKEALKAGKKIEAELEKTKSDLEKAVGEAAKNKDSWYRAAAEFENYKKRNEGIRKTAYEDGKKDAVTGILSIGDSVDRALTMVTDEKTLEGVKLIARSFKEALSAIGVEQIDPLGEKFDPETAEALATVPTENDEENDFVKTVYRKGYTLNGKMIRYAQVVVAKKS